MELTSTQYRILKSLLGSRQTKSYSVYWLRRCAPWWFLFLAMAGGFYFLLVPDSVEADWFFIGVLCGMILGDLDTLYASLHMREIYHELLDWERLEKLVAAYEGIPDKPV
jgi:hypothetical protein